MDKRGGGIRLCRRNFFVSETRENSQGNPSVLCFRIFLVTKKFMHKRGVVSRSSLDIFLSYSAEKIRRGTLLCFTEFPVSNKFMEKTGGGYQHFLSKSFCLTVPKNFVAEPISVSKFLGIDNVYASEG